MNIHLLSGGAAAAVVKGIQAEFEAITGCLVKGTFSAVGAMREQLLAGAPCDVVILTRPLIEGLVASGHVVASSVRSLGLVKTGVAVPRGSPHPAVDSADALRQAFEQAKGIYFPDPKQATAGIHFMKVLTALGLHEKLAERFRVYPNGATAMGEMARSNEPGQIGCTQVTEINYTPGVDLVGNLPKEFELATDYTLGVCTQSSHPALAQQLADLLAGPATHGIRRQGGFEF